VFFLFLAIFAGGRKDAAEGILRADPGGMGKAVRLQIETQRGVQEIVVEVGAREYEPDRIEELHRAAEAYLEAVVPGENESFLRVTENLFFPDSIPDTGETIEWSTDAPWLVSSFGEVFNEDLTEQEQVLITANIRYGFEYRTFSGLITVYPAEYTEEEKSVREVQKELLRLEETSRTEERFVIPETIQGYKVLQKENSTKGSRAFFVLLAVVVPLLLYHRCFDQLDTKRKKRKEQAEHCYTEFVTKFSLLLAAGISVRQVVYRLAEEYERNYGDGHVLTEELKVTRRELEHGYSETTVYEAFGRRMGVLAYRRMASLLTQNVSKGVQGMQNLLLQEAKEVMAQEKANIRQKGEQAGTKLLLPMTGLLLLVFAVLLVPAFRSF